MIACGVSKETFFRACSVCLSQLRWVCYIVLNNFALYFFLLTVLKKYRCFSLFFFQKHENFCFSSCEKIRSLYVSIWMFHYKYLFVSRISMLIKKCFQNYIIICTNKKLLFRSFTFFSLLFLTSQDIKAYVASL